MHGFSLLRGRRTPLARPTPWRSQVGHLLRLLVMPLALGAPLAAAQDESAAAPAPAQTPAPAPRPDEATPRNGPGLVVTRTSPTATPATSDQTSPTTDTPDGDDEDASRVAKRHRQARLLQEVIRLEAELASYSDHLDGDARTSARARDAAGYEAWLLTAERGTVRATIDELRVRITLLEQISHRQEAVDRVHLVALQNALADLNTDHAVISEQQRQRRLDLADQEALIARREGTQLRLAEVRRMIDALGSPPVPSTSEVPPAPGTPTATVGDAPASATPTAPGPSAAAPAATPGETPASGTGETPAAAPAPAATAP